MTTKEYLKSIGFTDEQVNLPTMQIKLTEYGFDTHISLLASLIDTTEVNNLCLEFNNLKCDSEYDDEETVINFAKKHDLKYKEGYYTIGNDICDFNLTYFFLENKSDQYLGVRFKGQYHLFEVTHIVEETTLPFLIYIDRDYYLEEIADLIFISEVVFEGKVLDIEDVLFLSKIIEDFKKCNDQDLYKIYFTYHHRNSNNIEYIEYKEYVDNYYYNIQSNQKNQLQLF